MPNVHGLEFRGVGPGILAGLIAGLVFGVTMQVVLIPSTVGIGVSMMRIVALMLNSVSLTVGWLFHLFNSAVIGGIFGWLMSRRDRGISIIGSATSGLLYGLLWWVIGGLILMPLMLGMPIFAPIESPELFPMAMAGFFGHALYGLILGLLFSLLVRAGRRRLPIGLADEDKPRHAA